MSRDGVDRMSDATKSYPLDPEVRATCALCLSAATHYTVKIAMAGELLAVCNEHRENS